MRRNHQIVTKNIALGKVAVTLAVLLFYCAAMRAYADTPQLRCPVFTTAVLPLAAQQTDPEAIERFQQIMKEVRSGPHKVLFLGDSLTRKWDPAIWRRDFVPLGALNAGVNLDRTENLLWRLKHGNLVGQHPKAVVLLIGTNDISRNRPAGIIAENIRSILKLLRSREPGARILLLGVLPRGESPHFFRRSQVRAVNELIKTCADSRHIFYDDAGTMLLDRNGRLTRAISPDGVHLSTKGYSLLSARLKSDLDQLLIPARLLERRQTKTQ